ncbi:hypothetical protein [Microbacterium sp. KR10-403]|uniref:hypothetical protein n=1 Tax=Microbacterium sp. KR10-403 TaxID=3158581 RepID=UPI0032E4496B
MANEISAEVVYLTVGPEYDGGELIRRADLPTDAIRTAFDVDGEHVDDGEPGHSYPVWSVER